MKEIQAFRKRNEKHFLNNDGSITAYIYNHDIHYLKKGVYHEINNHLIQDGTYYRNVDNTFQTSFNKKKNSNLLIYVQKDNYYLKMYLNNKKTKDFLKVFKDHQVRFENLLNDIDFYYDIYPSKVKESIILKNQKNIPSSLSFQIKTNLTLRIEQRKIEVKDKDTMIFMIDAPYMEDANHEKNQNIQYRLKKEKDYYLLTLNLDKEWLESKDRVYPVVIDPTIIDPKTNINVYDTYLASELPNANFDDMEELILGPKYRDLLKFELPTIGTGYDIIDAKFYLSPYNGVSLNQELINVYEVTKDWQENEATWNNMAENYNHDKIIDFNIAKRKNITDDDPCYNEFNITSLVKKWYAGSPNYGVLLKYNNEVESENNKNILYYSKTYDGINNKMKRAFLVIRYRNQNGLENYMTYQTRNFRDTSRYINNLTGNLTTILDLNETIGGNYPIGLKMVYNTNDVILNKNYGYGLGLKLNLHEIIKEIIIEGVSYLEYLDADGTLHYFIHDLDESGNEITSEYIDEDGLGLKAKIENDICILTDKDQNTYYFNKKNNDYYLTKLVNTNQDEVVITYNDDLKIIKVVDANQEEINLTYLDNKIIITSTYTTTTLNYQNEQIKTMVTKNGTTTFSYNTNQLLEKVVDTNLLAETYEYFPVSPYKIKKVKEIGLNGTIGNSLEFEYLYRSTKVKDHKNHYNVYSFNERGNTIGITNLINNDFSNAYGKINEYEEEKVTKTINDQAIIKNNKAVNHLKMETTPLRYANNYFPNSSFEEDLSYNTTTEFSRTGTKSLKINGMDNLSIHLNSNKTYTFSGYFKSDEDIDIHVLSSNSYLFIGTIKKSDDFKRYSCTFTLEENQSLVSIEFQVKNNGIAYLDDVQIEDEESASYHNLFSNGSFQNGLTNWTVSGRNMTNGEEVNTGVEIINIGNTKALKVSMQPHLSYAIASKIKMNGIGSLSEDHIGDFYNLSFWYKNSGLNKTGAMGQASSISVLLSYKYTNLPSDTGYGLSPIGLTANNNEWQYFSASIPADSRYNFDEIILTFLCENNANELLISNISITKDISINYHYNNEENGNLDKTKNTLGNTTEFTYDQNNQLTSMFNPKGNNFQFEYDNTIPDRILKGVSPTGISNEIIYDSYGNPIKTIIQNTNLNQELVSNENYSIRLKGTNEYFDCNFREKTISLKSDGCSHDSFKLIKNQNYYSFKIANLYLAFNNPFLTFSSLQNDQTLFTLEKLNNGSYLIKPKNSDYYLTKQNQILTFKAKNESDYHQQFYFEDIKTPLFIETKAEYQDHKFISKTIDALEKETLYNINPTNGLTNSVTDPSGSITNYIYNNKDQITKVKKEDKEVNYTYNNQDLLSKITCDNKEYQFNYDDFLNVKEVKINNQVLSSNLYEEKNGNLLKTTYGNNDAISYTYDDLDRIKTITNDTGTITNMYNSNNQLAQSTYGQYNYLYHYDPEGRISRYRMDDFLNPYFTIDYEYDKNSNPIKKKYQVSNSEQNIEYEYNKDDSVTKIDFDNHTLNNHYDYLGRLIKKDIDQNNLVEYTYLSNGKKTSTIVKSMKVNNQLYEYIYDDLYNITDIYLNKELIHHYEYDSFNELIKEDNYVNNKTYLYTYDTEGNLLFKKEYSLNTTNLLHTDTYEYNNLSWKDQLTKFNDEVLTYDEIGNPLTIGTKTLTWKNGKQLKTIEDNDLNIYYTYDKNGIRNSKTVNNIKTEYFTEGRQIIFEKTGNNMLYYIRDEEGSLIGFKYNDTMYYYIKNLQEDIIRITDSNHNLVCIYEYDSWGNILSIKDNLGNEIEDSSHIAHINPFRYRSYYYDKEIKLYYLNSRYYNPMWGRFINADRYIFTDTGIMGYNMYIYCNNNPILGIDSNGCIMLSGLLLVLGVSTGALTISELTRKNNQKQNNKAQKEIEAVQSKYYACPIDDPDFKNALKKNAKDIQDEMKGKNFYIKNKKFMSLVTDNAKYDLKNRPEWKGKTIYYDNHFMEPQDFGNYNFGYIGRAVGFPLWYLHMGASGNQIMKMNGEVFKNCFTTSVCDDPRDAYYIRLGAIAYDRDHS